MMTRTTTLTAFLCLAMALAACADEKKKDAPKGEDFSNMDLPNSDFKNKIFKDNSTFEDAELKGSNFTKAIAKGAVFVSATLTGANMTSADLSGADFRKAKVDQMYLWDTNLAGANMEGLDLSVAYGFHGVNLRGANLKKVTLTKVNECSFFGADLRGANLTQMKDVSRIKSNFRKAKYDKATSWPKGFDPVEAGAVLVTEETKK